MLLFLLLVAITNFFIYYLHLYIVFINFGYLEKMMDQIWYDCKRKWDAWNASMNKDKFTRERYKAMRSIVGNTSNKIILDFGAGWDPITKEMPAKKIIKVDGQKKFNPDILFNFNSPVFPFKNNYADLIFAGELLEHLINPFLFLKETHRILRKGGFLILSVPNITSLKNRLRVIFGLMPNFNALKYPVEEDQQWHHHSDWTLGWLKVFLSKVGFEIKKITTNGIIYRNSILLPSNLCPSAWGDILIVKAMKK